MLYIWVGPSLRLWGRVGTDPPIFRGARATHSFVAAARGRLHLASRFPGEWLDPLGRHPADAPEFVRAAGDLSVLVLRWSGDADVHTLFRGFAKDTRIPGLVLAEAERFEQPVPVPEQWDYLWYLGPGEIFRATHTTDGRPAIGCHTHGDVGILPCEARVPLAQMKQVGCNSKANNIRCFDILLVLFARGYTFKRDGQIKISLFV